MYENLKGRKLTKEDKKYFENWILKERKLSEIETKSGKIKLHPIMLMTNKNMKLNYGIKKELIQNYRYKDADEGDYKINQDSKIKL